MIGHEYFRCANHNLLARDLDKNYIAKYQMVGNLKDDNSLNKLIYTLSNR